MTSYHAVYFDVDGTLVDSRRHFDPNLLVVIRQLIANDIRIGLATGRMARSALPFAQAIAANAPLILYNGAQLVDPITTTVLKSHTLALNTAQHALAIVRQCGAPHVNVYVDNEIVIEAESPISREYSLKDAVPLRPVGDLRRFLISDPVKLMIVVDDPSRIEPLSRQLHLGLPSPCPTIVNSEPTYLEILPPGVTKGETLTAAAECLGVPLSGIVAFGDGLNDIELLQNAGLGIAMENAHAGLKAVADRVIGHHDTSSLAETLRELFDLRPLA